MRTFLLTGLVLAASASAQTPWDLASPALRVAAPEAGLVALDDGASDGLAWTWSPDPRWLVGSPVSRQAFGGGLDFGDRFLGSSVPNPDVPPIRIVFDAQVETVARVFDLYAGYVDAGTGVFRGAAYDVSDPVNPRRLNVAFTEWSVEKAMDGEWNPDGSAYGAREYLLVLASDYDGDGSTYAGMNARDLDTYLGLAARVPDGRALHEVPATLEVRPEPLREVRVAPVANGSAEVTWTAASGLDGASVLVFDADDDSGGHLGGASSEAGHVRLDGLDPSRTYTLHVDLRSATDVPLGARTVSVRPAVSDGVAAASSLSPVPGGSYGDVWGYVAPDGHEYGLIAVRDAGLSVVDVSGAPSAPPAAVGFVPTASGASDSKDVKTYGHYAYLANEYGPVQIIDLADPAAPVQVGTLDVQPSASLGGSHNLLVANDHLWVVGGRTTGNAGVRVYSLADPTAPAFVGEYQPRHQPNGYYHDFEVRGTLALGSAIYGGGGVDMLDVSDPSAIHLVGQGQFTYPGAGAHNTCMTEDGAYVFVGDEIGTDGNWVRTFDLRDLDNPELVGEIVVNPEAVVHNCYVRGDRLFVAHYTEGLRVFDVSDPEHPVPTAFYDTYPAPDLGYLGAWTAYPYLPSGKVLLSDMQTGLWVFTLEDAAVGTERPPEAPASLTVAPNPLGASASVRFALPEAGHVRLSVLDVRGREVAVLVDEPRGPGPHAAAFEAGALPAGVYVVRLGVDGRTAATARATVVR